MTESHLDDTHKIFAKNMKKKKRKKFLFGKQLKYKIKKYNKLN